MDILVIHLLNALLYASVLFLIAGGLSLIYGVMRIINLAHGDLALLGTFMVFAIVDNLGWSPFAALILVLPGAAVVGWALQRLMFDRAMRGGELAPLLATFGLSIVIGNLLLEVFSADTHGLSAGAIETKAWRISDDLSIGALPALIFVVAVLLLVGLQLFLSRAPLGRAMRATSAIAVATAALAGVFFGMRSSFDPTLGPAQLIFAFEAVIIGGLGSLWGTLVGGIVLGVAQAVGAEIDSSWSILAGHLVFLAVLAFRQGGIFAIQEARA
jgi:branched-chain amino acid transport system permease protein